MKIDLYIDKLEKLIKNKENKKNNENNENNEENVKDDEGEKDDEDEYIVHDVNQDNGEKNDQDNNEYEIIDEGYHEWDIYEWKNTKTNANTWSDAKNEDKDTKRIIKSLCSYFRIGDYKLLVLFFF